MRQYMYPIILLILLCANVSAQNYQLSIQLNHTTKEVPISLIVPPIQEKYAYFRLPLPEQRKPIPIKRYISQFAAYDKNNQPLPYTFYDDNTIVITYANRLHHIEYQLPNITTSNNKTPRYIISRSGYYGYIAGYAHYPYHIHITHPPELYGASALIDQDSSQQHDRFELPNYAQLANSIMLYAKPDTSSFAYNGTRYHIAIHAESGNISARQTRYPLQNVVETAAPYLKHLPPNYHFIFTFSNNNNNAPLHDITAYSGYADIGASFYALPETYTTHNFYDLVQTQAMHELLHSITPFALHSQETEYSQTNKKGIGKHLWLYEGVTEYLSQWLLLRGGMKTETEFWHEISRRIQNAKRVDDAILTNLSQHIYQRQQTTARYATYNRGMVAAFYLDVLINQLCLQKKQAQTPHNLADLLEQLINQYQGKAFDDDALFQDIINKTSPQIGDFLHRYIDNNKPLPHQQIAQILGMQYFELIEEEAATFGDFNLIPDYKKEKLFFSTPKKNDEKFKCLLPFERNDMLLTLNKDTINTSNINQYLALLYHPKPNTPLTLSVQRKEQIIALSAMPRSKIQRYRHAFRNDKQANQEALEIKKQILGNSK